MHLHWASWMHGGTLALVHCSGFPTFCHLFIDPNGGFLPKSVANPYHPHFCIQRLSQKYTNGHHPTTQICFIYPSSHSQKIPGPYPAMQSFYPPQPRHFGESMPNQHFLIGGLFQGSTNNSHEHHLFHLPQQPVCTKSLAHMPPPKVFTQPWIFVHNPS